VSFTWALIRYNIVIWNGKRNRAEGFSQLALSPILMRTYLAKRRQEIALRLQLEFARQAAGKAPGYLTIDGESVPYDLGLAALNSGSAFLIGGLLVGLVTPSDDF